MSVLKMITCNEEDLAEDKIKENVSVLLGKALPIFERRKQLYERYNRASTNDDDIKVALEFYISTIAIGYFGGKEPQYKVKKINETQKNIIKKLFNFIIGDKDTFQEFQATIDRITKYNDNESFFYDLVKDYLITKAGYGILYENKDNEIVFANTSSLETVAIWNNDVPRRKIGLLRVWYDTYAENRIITNVEIRTEKYKKNFKDGKEQDKIDKNTKFEFEESGSQNLLWDDTPIIAVENPDGLALFELVIPLIKRFERIIENNSNIFEYNDSATKLAVSGYQPDNDLLITKAELEAHRKGEESTETYTGEDANDLVMNPYRIAEDQALIKSKVLYTDKDGKISWITKDINDTASENHKNTLLDLILMITGVPNVTDQGFTDADNSSALEKKFFPLDQALQQADKLFKKELLRMWEMITHRINEKSGTNYDFRDIEVILIRNLPQNYQEIVDSWLKLRGLLPDKTIIDHLPYDLDSESELAEMDSQNQENIEKNIENMKKIGQDTNGNILSINQNNPNKQFEAKDEVKRENIKKSDTVSKKSNKKDKIDE